mmetsp:Transcript_66612/g.139058  ORF Transcript_66612/g.139058 Transcript_66612/m.139058 type:complete len:452 (-) Transcript_66612:160-1515(-)|eukprot:CAMPEP_0206445678 /NCGR_PEP_ID=MMETSP0324_2-20121206/15659_1 /ASSEMBLY_ACC=CAM_ASM_000836 /TAXON_ID=2866 /ORGANISM="Crypthecodinium cohnii, Strain Seligo" /LENGTH=451 /DNA_ID=CAMNT_0053913955 /DNA_START=58 /DNA_END=1413 /DNA_ORIENTATION=-
MGNCVAGICGGESSPPKAPAQCNVQGYDHAPEAETTVPAATKDSEKGSETTADPSAPSPMATAEEPEEEEIPPTDPIVLDTMQGEWYSSTGARIKVEGTEVTLNGMVMKVHPVTLDDDGMVVSIGRIWQMKGWKAPDKIEFKEAPSREVMEHARSVVWTRASEKSTAERTAHLAGLGYTGSAKDVMSRGIEGCCPGTCDAKASVAVDDKDKDKAELKLLNDLISQWRLPGMENIPPRKVIPDFSNRGHTGLSVEHVHYLAASFQDKGFQTRKGNQGHDIPVLVKQPVASDLGKRSIENWRSKVKDEAGFPPLEHYEKLFKETEVYTSLGNGHFNQALNLFLNECPSIYRDRKYTIGNDRNLKDAVHKGVSAIILKPEIPLRDRETISRLLNSKREFKWNVNADGSLDIIDAAEDTSTCKQFEALSKVLDAVELNCLVRSELGVKESHRIGQ